METNLSLAPLALWKVVGWDCLALGIATAVANFHPKVRQQTKVRQAIQSWWPVVVVASLGILLGPLMTFLVFACVSSFLIYEGLKLLNLPENARKLYTVFGILQTWACHAALPTHPWVALSIALATGFLLLPIVQMILAGPQGYIRQAGGAQWILNSATVLFSFASLVILQEQKARPYGGQGLGVFLFTEVIVADAMQFVGGKLFGRTPLIPSVSPGKTVEGALFGMIVTGAVGLVLSPMLLGITALQGFLVGAAVCALSLAGDLVVSAWKRDAGVKDTGSVLPGQGGVLDRCDSIIYVAPLFWLLTSFLI